jgi:hypothetical protein
LLMIDPRLVFVQLVFVQYSSMSVGWAVVPIYEEG